MWLDNRGRLFGRFSVVDLAAVLTLVPVFLFLHFAFLIAAHRTLSLYSVTPVRIRAGSEEWIRITGTGMDNTCRVQFSPQYEFQDVHVWNPAILETHLPDHALPWQYDVVVRNDRGHTDILRNAIEVYWVPRVDRVAPRKIYGGGNIEIEGDYFQTNAEVWIGQQRSKKVERVSPQRLRVHLQPEEELQPGTYDVRISNNQPEMDFTFDERLRPKARNTDPSETEFTLAKAIEILPKPRVTKIFPRKILRGDPVDLSIRGEFFPPDAVLLLGPNNLPLETVWVSSSQLRARVTPRLVRDGTHDLYLTIPDVSPVKIFSSAITIIPPVVQIVPRTIQTTLVEILLHENLPEETLRHLKSLSGWRWVQQVEIRPGQNFIIRSTPIRRRILAHVVIETAFSGKAGEESIRTLTYRGNPVKKGKTITVTLGGQSVTGEVVSDPVLVCMESHAE